MIIQTTRRSITPLNSLGIGLGVSLGSYGLYYNRIFKEFLSSATSEFLNMQSGNAAPVFYVEAIVSGVSALVGQSFTSSNFVIDGGVIDRSKPVFPGDRSRIISSDVTIKVDNSTQRFTPSLTASIWFNADRYLGTEINYWAGFRNVSGTALLIQRGSFVLDNLKIDGRKNIAFLRCEDKFKRALESRIGVAASGTATPLTFTGTVASRTVIESLLLTGAGLTASNISIAEGLVNFVNLSLNNQTVSNALADVAEASDGFIFTNRRGVLTFQSNAPTFGDVNQADFTATDSGHYANLFWEQDRDDLVSKVILNFQSGTSVAVAVENSLTGRTINIENDNVQTTADAVAISTRFADRFSGQVTRVQMNAIWLPSLEIGNKIAIVNNNADLTGGVFEIYRIEEEPTRGKMNINLVSQRAPGKFTFFSDASATICGTVFTGGANERNGWQAGFGFFCRETTTAVNPAFDEDGNNNNVINTSISSSGIGGTGIELAFEYY